ncbi:MAG TPA: MgtC/SapB family protein, partial [Fluviicola sp.]|nr:MgtC/SapB family protein [Fluviicola sp.]
MMISWQEVLIRLALAALLGGLIGLERERKNWAAGLRTHMMVCVGACLIMLVSTHGFYEVINENHISFDPSRVAAQVVSGIGFIGAGAIMFLKDGIIRGLTTAA